MFLIVPTNGRIYCAVFFVFLLGLPLLLLSIAIGENDSEAILFHGVTAAVFISSYILSYVRCSSPVMTYWQGLCIVCSHWLSWFIVLSLIVIFPLLFVIHLVSLLCAILSLVAGRSFAQIPFLYLAYWGSIGEFDLARAKQELRTLPAVSPKDIVV